LSGTTDSKDVCDVKAVLIAMDKQLAWADHEFDEGISSVGCTGRVSGIICVLDELVDESEARTIELGGNA